MCDSQGWVPTWTKLLVLEMNQAETGMNREAAHVAQCYCALLIAGYGLIQK
jgi:hypothetical protein